MSAVLVLVLVVIALVAAIVLFAMAGMRLVGAPALVAWGLALVAFALALSPVISLLSRAKG